MRIKAFSTLTLGVGLGVLGVQLAACSNSADDCNATASCGTSGTPTTAGTSGKNGGGSSGAEGGAESGGSSSGGSQGTSGTSGNGGSGGSGGVECNGDVANDPTCWTTNELGVFVSSDTGNDTEGDGTKEKPYATITKAIGAAAGKNVYVCLGEAEAYEEKLTITDAEGDGSKIYGGFLCSDWTHDVGRFVTVESPENIALRIQDVTSVHIENVKFHAANGFEGNPSSYGAFITDSAGVVLRRVELAAGDGLPGADGDEGGAGENGSVAGLAPVGSAACTAAAPGTWQASNACGSQGGKGGEGQQNIADANNGSSGVPTTNVTGNITNRGLGETSENAELAGKVGADGNAGALGLQAALGGSFSSTGYVPASGNVGKAGYPGQGGGGGGAAIGSGACFGASGGAGGMGGCGGQPGQGGGGGGASIGLLSWNSEVVVEASKILSAAGGSGGKGGAGGLRGQGGKGGDGGVGSGSLNDAGDGGPGGDGGDGGSGSGGTGGPSYAIAFSGAKPVYTVPETTLTAGDGGGKGIGGQVLDAKAPDGFDGDSADEFEIQ